MTLANLDSLVFPATVQIDFADGSNRRIQVPVEAWLQQSRITLNVAGDQPIAAVTVDPDHVLPDNDRRNNVLRPKRE